uniref:Glycosyltransferase RgtA/B/C/D-like domain-containing protein n=2 Tax=Litorilinea aerophila TaxID=1204385 RepID=A0A540V9V3_9CHLR
MARCPMAEMQASAGRSRPRLAWLEPALLAFLLLLGAGLRFYRLDASSLWSDEGNTWALMGRSFARIAQDAAADIHPPGYYWLLKLWTLAFGADVIGLRSFSALAGTLLLYGIYRIGVLLGGRRLGLLALLLAALNPFLVYYSQEARMYMALALAGTGLFWALLVLMAAPAGRGSPRAVALGYVAAGAIGLWLHYSFPVLLAAAGLAYLWHWWQGAPRRWQDLGRFVGLNAVVLALFLPWLPTALSRVRQWPKGGVPIGLGEGLQMLLETLLFGPLRQTPEPTWPWLVAAGLLPLLGLWALRRREQAVALGLWLAAPPALMFGLGLFSEAFLKFLLTMAPAWCLLAAAAAWLLPRRPGPGMALLAAGGLALAALTLPGYYRDPTARDNYAGVARYVAALGDPAQDLVLLDAPGQQEVWAYYDPGFPVLALPQQRPPDPEATLATLAEAVADRRQVFALFWATDEADPDGLVERWLDQQAFKGLESWQGNLRFVVYTLPNRLTCTALQPPAALEGGITLTGLCQPQVPQQVAAGDVALVGLRWQAEAPPAARYKVTVQLLDARSQVIAQHDSEPAGGSQPTDTWQPGTTYVDNHGLTIPPGTPPGVYRLIVAMYDPATGRRLAGPQGDHMALGEVHVQRAARPIPSDILPVQHRSDIVLGPVRLVGYGLHRKGFSHQPEAPIQPGDLVHFTFLWQAPSPLPADWPADLQFTLRLGEQVLTAPLAGGLYPTGQWQAGELVRGEFDLPYDGSRERPILTVAGDLYRLSPLPR